MSQRAPIHSSRLFGQPSLIAACGLSAGLFASGWINTDGKAVLADEGRQPANPAAAAAPEGKPALTETVSGPRFQPSAAVTHVIGPVDSEGYVDFIAALNAKLGNGVAPSENAAVPIIEALGDCEHNPEVMGKLREALGLPAALDPSREFVTLGDYCKQQALAPAENTALYEQTSRLTKTPWTAEQVPVLAALLKRNAWSLDTIQRGVQRPKYFRPYVRRNPTDPMVALLLPDVQEFREAARQLCQRAMLALGQGNASAALADIVATHQFGQHVSRGGTLIEGLVGMAIDAIATDAGIVWAHSPQVTPAELQAYRQALEQLGSIGIVEMQLTEHERLMALDAVQHLARGRGQVNELMAPPPVASGPGLRPMIDVRQLTEGLIGFSVDWAATMRTMNTQFDQLAESLKGSRSERTEAFSALNQRLKDQRAEIGTLTGVAKMVIGGGKSRGKTFGTILAGMLIPATETCLKAQDRSRTKRQIQIVGLAVVEQIRRGGPVPGSLTEATAAVVQESGAKSADSAKGTALPLVDCFSNSELRYQPSANGFVLYSIGPNGVDDGGRNTLGSTSSGTPVADDLVFAFTLTQP